MQITRDDQRLADAAMTLTGAVAVAIGGSRASGVDDAGSDTDAYLFRRGAPGPADERQRALRPVADGDVVESTAWGLENHLSMSGRFTELVHLDLDEIDRTVEQAYSVGLSDEAYPTAFLYTVATCVPVRDAGGELAALQQRLATYPEATRARLLAELPEYLHSYLEQLTKAQARGDLPSVAHRLGKLADAWFNLLFAVNRTLQPGEKRLLVHASSLPVQPREMTTRWDEALGLGAADARLPRLLASLVDDLLELAT